MAQAAGVAIDAPETGRRHLLDLDQLETFQIIAVTKNFSRAALELGCSQSTVTIRIKALERELGVALFERYRFSKNVVLTPAGHRALKYASQLIALANEAKEVVIGATRT